MLSTPNNLSRCLAGSMGKGGKSGPSSPEEWWENLCKTPVNISHICKAPRGSAWQAQLGGGGSSGEARVI